MHSFHFLTRASAAILILILCLQLRTNNAQDSDENAIDMNLILPETVKANEEVIAKLELRTTLNECMVVEARLRTSDPMETSFNFIQTVCLCNDYPRNLYWDFTAKHTMYIQAEAEAVFTRGICPQNKAVVPIEGDHNLVFNKLTVTDEEWSPSRPSSGLSSTDTCPGSLKIKPLTNNTEEL